MLSDKVKNKIIKFGDWLYNITNDIAYCSFYIIFSVIRAAIIAIKLAWEDAE